MSRAPIAASRGRQTVLRVERIDEVRWRIPGDQRPDMRVDGVVFASDRLMDDLRGDPALVQVANVATLPGIVGASLAMPDVHWGYGFPIGGVAAVRQDGGVITPGGIGFDINCGVRLLRSELAMDEISPHLERLADALFEAVPSGLGVRSGHRATSAELEEVLRDGSRWAIEHGAGWPLDLDLTEEHGTFPGAEPGAVSQHARERGADQLGTLGSGNHFLELDVVDEVRDEVASVALGLSVGQTVILIHCGSRGLGHQVCTDHVAVLDRTMRRHGISVPDPQLACAPLDSVEGRAYLGAMAAAANFAFANRQLITHAVRGAFERVLGSDSRDLGLELVYDVSHNIAKFEEHVVDGRTLQVVVQRKGATRAFPAGHPDVPAAYRAVGQPILVPGDMGRCSFVAVGAPGSMTGSFGSTCHGAGRRLSRHAALRELLGVDVGRDLARAGVIVRTDRPRQLGEEAPIAYKDVSEVVDVAERAGQLRLVARLRPRVVIKG